MSTSSEVPAHRACAACRSQKVRCIIDESTPDLCQRCARSGRPCVFTPLQKRKQRKRTDTRVAELEREMRTVRAALQEKEKEQGTRSTSPSQLDSQRGKPLGLWYASTSQNAPQLGQAGNWTLEEEEVDTPMRRVQAAGTSLWYGNREAEELPAPKHSLILTLRPWKFANAPLEDTKDVIDRGLLSMATARQLFDMYRAELFPHYPMVAVPDSTTADEMRTAKPALFLAVIAASAGKESSELSATLDKEVLQAYATRSLVQSEKSLELVQALLISSVWYHPPSKFGQLKYYEYIHMAATMAMDIGIGSRPTRSRAQFQQRRTRPPHAMHPAEDITNPDLSMTPRFRDSSPDTASLESRRTFLACYFICAGVSLSLRRPNLLRVSSYIRESVDYIEQSPNALPTDPTLVAWVRLIMIAEEISVGFCYDDPGGIAALTELRTQLMLRDFERRLSTWYTDLPQVIGSGSLPGSLIIMYYTIRLYLFEIALHVDHDPEDFRAPYQMGGITPLPDSDKISTQVLAEAIAECITSAHELLNTFLAMEVESLKAFPVFSYVRISFAAFILAKLCLSAAHPRSRIGGVLDRSSLKAESYLDRAILHIRNVVGPKRSRVPSIFLALLFKLRQWCINPEIIEQSEHESERPKIEDHINRPVSMISGLDIEEHESRIGDHGSSDENSPHTVEGDSVTYKAHDLAKPSVRFVDDVRIFGGGTEYPLTEAPTRANNPMPMAGMQHEFCEDLTVATAAAAAHSSTTVSGDMWTMDQMNLDANLLQMLGDIGAYSAGGLTGLEDWANMPADFMNMGNMDYNWTIQNANGGSANVM